MPGKIEGINYVMLPKYEENPKEYLRLYYQQYRKSTNNQYYKEYYKKINKDLMPGVQNYTELQKIEKRIL